MSIEIISFFEGDDDVEEQRSFLENMHTVASNWRFNAFLDDLEKAMIQRHLENIKRILKGNRLETTHQ